MSENKPVQELLHEQQIKKPVATVDNATEVPHTSRELLKGLAKGSSENQVHANEANEHAEEDRYLEDARAMGDYYVGVIKNLTGGREDMPTIATAGEAVGSQADAMRQSVETHRQLQHALATEKDMNARQLIDQAFPEAVYDETLSDPSKYRMQEISQGIYAIYIDTDMYNKLMPGSQAVAVRVPNGVSFLMVREYGDSVDEGLKARDIAENIPHETHHIAWGFMKKDGIVQSRESDEEIGKAFTMYQDELVAKLCTDGEMISYTHLSVIGSEQREQLKKEAPDTVDQIFAKTGAMNEILIGIERLRQRTDIRKQDLILPSMTAKTFDELEATLSRMRSIMEQRVQPEEDKSARSSGGWDFIDVA